MSDRIPRLLFAGGGTGGHLFPALAIADELRKIKPDAEIIFVGTKNKIEARVVPQRGYAFKSIWISGFHRSLRPANLAFPLKVVVSLIQSFFAIRDFRPDVVIGTGGYVCGPVLSIASWLGIPTIIHESNSYPGITTRLLAERATKVFLGFERARNWLKRTDNVELVGTPTRRGLDEAARTEAASFFGLDASQRVVLVVGGSLGAASINNAVGRMAERMTKSGVQLIWQAGNAGFQQAKQQLGGQTTGWVGSFIERMDLAYAAADLVICRSGATTLAELARVGKPAVLIPFPHAAGDHQTHNARTFVDAGAAIMIQDNEIGSQLEPVLFGLLADADRRRRMAAASRQLARPDAGRVIADRILSLIKIN